MRKMAALVSGMRDIAHSSNQGDPLSMCPNETSYLFESSMLYHIDHKIPSSKDHLL